MICAIDIETYDPHLKLWGPGPIRNDGYIIGIGAYCPELHVDTFYKPDDPAIRKLLEYPVDKVFHNGVYDVDWLVNGPDHFTINGRIEDTMTRETLLDAYDYSYALDHCCDKRHVEGKNKSDTIDAWWAAQGKKTKAVEHLNEIPWHIVAKYCKQDCKATWLLYNAQQPLLEEQGLLAANDIEVRLYPWLMETRRNGMIVDWDKRRALSDSLNTELELLHAEFVAKYGNVNTGSYIEMEKLWKSLGIPVIYTDKGRPSFSHDVLADVNHPVAELILKIRSLEKLLSTFIDGQFVDLSYNGRIWPNLFPAKRDDGGTVTGRFSSQNPNGQNIPARGDKHGKEIRSLFIPEEGCLLGAFDYKQIEYRIFTHFAVGPGAKEAQELYNKQPVDYHQMVQDMMGWSFPDDPDKMKAFRHVTKNLNFTCCSPDSYFATRRGYIKATELRNDDLLTLDSGKWRAFIGRKHQYRISLSNGQQFKVTHDHPFKLFGKEVGASTLKVGDTFDVVPCTYWGEMQNSSVKYTFHGKDREMNFIVDESCAYLLGVWLGDGSLHMQYKTGEPSALSFCTPPENTQRLKDILGHKCTTVKKTDIWEVWYCTSKPLAKWVLENCGRTESKHVPDFIYRSPRNVMVAFLTGFLDSDGTVYNNKPQLLNTNEYLMRGLARCCAMLGWDATWSEERTPTEKSLYRLKIRKTELTYKELQGLVRKWDYSMTSGNWSPTYVTEIVDIGIQDTFCIELPPPHWYEAECHINHNSIYGLGPKSFAERFKYPLLMAHPGTDPSELFSLAKSLQDEYYHKITFAKPTCNKIQEVAASRGYVKTIAGRRQRVTPDGKLYKLVNYLIQGSAGDLFKKAMVDAWDAGVFNVLKSHIMVHDEEVFSIPQTKEGYEACEELARCMSNAYKLKVPIGVDTEIGPDWGHCDEDNWKEFKSRWVK